MRVILESPLSARDLPEVGNFEFAGLDSMQHAGHRDRFFGFSLEATCRVSEMIFRISIAGSMPASWWFSDLDISMPVSLVSFHEFSKFHVSFRFSPRKLSGISFSSFSNAQVFLSWACFQSDSRFLITQPTRRRRRRSADFRSFSTPFAEPRWKMPCARFRREPSQRRCEAALPRAENYSAG